MSLHASKRIEITNPPVGGHFRFLGPKHAGRLVRRGEAELLPDGRLRLTEKLRRILASASKPQGVPGVGYDAVRRQMRTAEKRRIPIAQPPERPTKRKIVVAHSGPAGKVKVVWAAELKTCDWRGVPHG